MKNYLYKEFKLCISPVNYLFLAVTAMLLIPSYPCYVPFFYLCLSIFFIFNNADLNKDLAYSMILPITKKDIVKSRCIIIAVYEVVATIFTIPFSLIMTQVWKIENLAGIDATVGFYGLQLILISFFNFFMLTKYYKKAEKPGIAFLVGSIIYWIIYAFLEFPFWLKNVLNNDFIFMMDSTAWSDQIKQLPVLAVGIVVFILGWILTYKVSANRFEKVDL